KLGDELPFPRTEEPLLGGVKVLGDRRGRRFDARPRSQELGGETRLGPISEIARSIAFFSSRTLPGQSCWPSIAKASAETSTACWDTKWATRRGMSSLRSRSGGSRTRRTANRWYRSRRK